jgi:16S rRNA (guanine966-N2)-methyltransferase
VSPGARVRPTAEEVRAGWMTRLEPDLEGARLLELFAGSGALGIEALSRGARSVDFVEDGPASLHALKANVAAFPLRRRARVFKRDAIPFVEALDAGAYDIALADPPYGSRKLDRVVERWLEVPFSRVLCVEHERGRALPAGGSSRTRRQTYAFGDTAVTFLRAAKPRPSG